MYVPPTPAVADHVIDAASHTRGHAASRIPRQHAHVNEPVVPYCRPDGEVGGTVPPNQKGRITVLETVVAPTMLLSKTGNEYPEAWEHDCWWCAHPFDARPVGLPVREPKRSGSDITYELQGFYCSWNCAIAACNGQYGGSAAPRNSFSHLCMLWRQLNRLSDVPMIANDVRLQAAPHFSLLKRFGGPLSIDEFRAETQSRISCFPQHMHVLPQGFDLHRVGDLTMEVVEARATRDRLRRERQKLAQTTLICDVPAALSSEVKAKKRAAKARRKPLTSEEISVLPESSAYKKNGRYRRKTIDDEAAEAAKVDEVVHDERMSSSHVFMPKRSRADVRAERATATAKKKRIQRRKAGPVCVAEDLGRGREEPVADAGAPHTPAEVREVRDLTARYRQNNLLNMLSMKPARNKDEP